MANPSWLPKAIKLYEAGTSVRQISLQVPVSEATVWRHLQGQVTMRTGRGELHCSYKLSPGAVARAAKRYTAGETLAQVAKDLGVTAHTLGVHIRPFVTIRPKGSRGI